MDHKPPADREQLQKWLANWRAVNEAQDALVRSSPPSDPAASLATALSMIDFALRMTRGHAPVGRRQDDDADSVRRSWIRLRAAYGR
jgi:hypothetical protein